MLRIAESINKNNITEFDFVRLEHWDDFDIIENIITKKLGFLKFEELDGVAIRIRVFSKDKFKFILMHDDHVGNCAFCEMESDVDKLRILTQKIIEILKSF